MLKNDTNWTKEVDNLHFYFFHADNDTWLHSLYTLTIDRHRTLLFRTFCHHFCPTIVSSINTIVSSTSYNCVLIFMQLCPPLQYLNRRLQNKSWDLIYGLLGKSDWYYWMSLSLRSNFLLPFTHKSLCSNPWLSQINANKASYMYVPFKIISSETVNARIGLLFKFDLFFRTC